MKKNIIKNAIVAVVAVFVLAPVGLWRYSKKVPSKPVNTAGQNIAAPLPPAQNPDDVPGIETSTPAANQNDGASSTAAENSPKLASDPQNIKDIQDSYLNFNYQDRGVALSYQYPNQYDSGENDYPAGLAPEQSCAHTVSIPFRSGSRILRVYDSGGNNPRPEGGENSSEGSGLPPCFSDDMCGNELRLVVYDKNTKTSRYIGSLRCVNGSNWGALFVPRAITNDDKKIILMAYMRSPGAGGGAVDLGYSVMEIPLSPLDHEAFIDPLPAIIATPSAYFYDSSGKVIYIDEGDNAPSYGRPGPLNGSKIMFRNLSDNTVKTVYAEKDTLYEITGINEKAGQFTFKATRLAFSEACPRQEGNIYCAQKDIQERTGALP